MTSNNSRGRFGVEHPVQKIRIVAVGLLLSMILFSFGSVIFILPAMFLIAEYGALGWPMIIGLIVVSIGILSYRGYKKNLKKALAEAEPITQETHPELVDTIELVQQEAESRGMEPPTLYVHPAATTNALALGRRDDGHIILMEKLVQETDGLSELNAIVGHELAHLDNRDSVMMATLSGFKDLVVWAFTWMNYFAHRLMYRMLCFSMRKTPVWGPDRDRELRKGSRKAARLMSSPIGLCEKSISRNREYIADAEGAQVASPESMIAALETIHNADGNSQDFEVSQSLCIHGPRSGFLARLRSTHPPIEKRINYIEDISG